MTVRSKYFLKVKHLNIDNSGEGLNFSKGGSQHRGMSKSNMFDKSIFKWLIFQKPNHFKRDCIERGDNEDFVWIRIFSDDNSYESAYVLVVSSLEIGEDWIMDPGCSYLTCTKNNFETLKMEQDGFVLLGGNKACKVHDNVMIELKMFDVREFLLQLKVCYRDQAKFVIHKHVWCSRLLH